MAKKKTSDSPAPWDPSEPEDTAVTDPLEASKIPDPPSAPEPPPPVEESAPEPPPPAKDPDPPPPPVVKYRVAQKTTVSINGQLCTLNPGDTVSESSYGPAGMAAIKSANVPLVEIKEE